MRTGRSLRKLIATGLAVCLVIFCASRVRPNLGALPTRQQPAVPKSPLTGEQARAALVDLLRNDLTAFQRQLDPDELAKQPVTGNARDRYRVGQFSIDVSAATYQVIIQYGCIFDYRGTFTFERGRWVASKPRWVSAALVK
jgi:hypothetical protein